MDGAEGRFECVLTTSRFLTSRQIPIWACHEVILNCKSIMVDELSEVDLTGNRHVEETVWLHLRLERLRVLVVLVHVFIFEFLRLIFIIFLIFRLRVVAAHIVNICECGADLVYLLCHLFTSIQFY